MNIHSRLATHKSPVFRDFLADLEGAGVLALVPVALCLLLFAAELFGR